MAGSFQDFERALNIRLFRMDTKRRLKLWRKLGKQLSDGVQLINALEEQANIAKRGSPLQIALTEWVKVLRNGRSLSMAVREWVSTEESMLISAGEAAGDIPGGLASVVKVKRAGQQITSAVLGGVMYPLFIAVVAFGMLYLFSYKVIPAFEMAARGGSWTGMARMIIDFTHFAQAWLHWIVLAFAAMVIGMVVSMPIWSGNGRIYADRFPPYSIYRMMQGSSWLISLSALIQANMRMEDALARLLERAPQWGKVRMAAALRGLRRGQNLAEALYTSGYEFPDREIISDLRVYANKSGLDEALRMVGDEWIEESVERIKSMMGIVFGVILVFAGLVIMFEVSGMMALMLQLNSQVRGR